MSDPYLHAYLSFGPMDKLHRADCGHGQRSHASGNAAELTGPVARIIHSAVLTEADPLLRPCGLCKPEIKGVLVEGRA